MNIMMVGSSYAPEETGIAPYTTGLAEHLVRRGHAVTLVTGMPSYPQWRVYPQYRGVLRKTEMRRGVEIRRVRGYIPRKQSTLHRGMYELGFLLGSLTVSRLPRPEVVMGIVPALVSGVLARVAARRFDCPYGLVFQDLTAPAASQSGVGGHRVAETIGAVEGWAARGAAAIGVIADGFVPYLASLGVDGGRIRRVHNWTHINEPTIDRPTVRQRLGFPSDAVVCLHAGNMGFKQGLSNVIECARLAREDHPRLLFVLMGDGSQRPLLVSLAERYQLRNLRFLPIQPPDMFPSVLAAADVLLVNQRAMVTNMSLPGKLTSYFASGRPVVAAVAPESETAREILKTGGGILALPDRPDLLLEAVRCLVADPTVQEQLGGAGKRYAQTTLGADQALAGLEALVGVAAGQCIDQDRALTI